MAEEVRSLFLKTWTLSFAYGGCYNIVQVYECDAGVSVLNREGPRQLV